MSVFDPFLTATDMARAIRARELTACDVVEALLGRIASENPRLNAIVTLDVAGAHERAHAADQALARGELWGPLHGVPFTLKDSHATAGMRTTVGHAAFEHHVPVEDGAVAARLKAAGGILLGKTNVPPLLMSAQTDNPIFGRTSNPWDVTRTPGGSSGGAGAAVAAGLVPFDIGSDMSGSIRIPASYCGVFGLKPSANRVPSTGHIPPPPGAPRVDRFLAASGPLARSVQDLDLIMRVLAGPDGRDGEVAPLPWRDVAPRAARSLRIAYLPALPDVPTAREVSATIARVVEALAREGAHVEERDPGFTAPALNEVWRAFLPVFTSAMVELSGIALSTGAKESPPPSLTDWLRVLDRRDAVVAAADAQLSQFDAFLSPATISTAFPHRPPRTPIPVDDVQVESRFVDHYLYPWSFTGHPALVLPAGLGADGLPIGVQLVARRWDDEKLLAIASAVVDVIGGFRAPPAQS
jgi:amidase